MKKLFFIVSAAIAFAIVLTLNFKSFNKTKVYTNLESLIELPIAQAEDGGDKRCDWEGGLGIPFWDRTCNDCQIHFNNWYNNPYSCYN